MPAAAQSWRGPFLRYLAGRGLSLAGSTLATIVLAFAVLDAGGDAFAVGLVLTTSVLTQALGLPVAGVLADRAPRRRVVVAANVALAVAQTTMGLLLVIAPDRVPMVAFVAAAAVSGAAAAATKPALQGIVVELVPPESRQSANAWHRLVVNVARVGVPGLGGVLAAAVGFGPVLIGAGAAFVASAVVLATLPLGVVRAAPATWWADAREGGAAVAGRTWMWTYLLSGAVGVPLWLAGYQLLGPVIAAQRPAGLQFWGWAVSAFVVGMLAGSLVALRWRPRRPMLATVAVLLAWPLPLAVLALDVHLAWVLVPMAISGLALDLSIVFFETARQQHVPERLIGRVTSIGQLSELALVPVGYLLGGSVADRIGPAPVLWGCVAGLVGCTAALFAVRDIRTLTWRLEPEGHKVGR
ncbi:MFS transporter [Jiangella endophytica]|uniref:MFS transporter n=1 Tax=Jiangella endophytica TaxID=1623398 RepID=UPI000E340D16|nr:MFS transporter [Jiangella endophytica]